MWKHTEIQWQLAQMGVVERKYGVCITSWGDDRKVGWLAGRLASWVGRGGAWLLLRVHMSPRKWPGGTVREGKGGHNACMARI